MAAVSCGSACGPSRRGPGGERHRRTDRRRDHLAAAASRRAAKRAGLRTTTLGAAPAVLWEGRREDRRETGTRQRAIDEAVEPRRVEVARRRPRARKIVGGGLLPGAGLADREVRAEPLPVLGGERAEPGEPVAGGARPVEEVVGVDHGRGGGSGRHPTSSISARASSCSMRLRSASFASRSRLRTVLSGTPVASATSCRE